MQIITMLSVGSTQGEFFLQDFIEPYNKVFFREEEVYNPRALSNKLLTSDMLCFTLTSHDSICEVVDFCGMILKLLPNTKVKEILINDSLINGKAEKLEYYVTEVTELLGMSGLNVCRMSKPLNYDGNTDLDSDIMNNIKDYLKDIFSVRDMINPFPTKMSFSLRNKSVQSKKISYN